MSELDRVYGQLFKEVNLSSDIIEFSTVKVLDEILKDGSSMILAIEKQGEVLSKKLAEAIVARRQFQAEVMDLKSLAYSTARKSVDEFKAKAKELGLDVSGVKQLKDIENLVSKTKEYEAYDKSFPTIPQV